MGYRDDHTFGVWTGARQHCVFSVSPSSKTCRVDNASTTASDELLDTNLTMYLFGRNYNGEAGQQMIGKIYCCSITQGGTLVRDFIPVRVGRFGYLFDRVTGKFFANQGTGDFLLGPDIGMIPGRLHPMGVSSWGVGYKPYDAEVGWLESTGTQWIDTGVAGAKNLHVEIDAFNNPSGPGTYCAVFGARVSSASEQFDVWWYASSWGTASQRNAVRYDYGTNTTSPADTRAYSSAIMTRSTIAIANGVLTVAGQTLTPTYLSQSPASGLANYLFAINAAGTASLGNNPLRVYFCAIYDGSTLVRDFIPVRKNGVGYLYDKANPTGGPLGNGLYGNAGTGEFVVGPDIS